MAWTQLIQPNLGVKGTLGNCLMYSREVFGIAKKYDSAWEGWSNSALKHGDQSFPSVAVPVWFEHWGTYGSPPKYGNWGHVAVRMPNGQIYSSPYNSRTSHAVLSSIQEVEKLYKCKYVGWSEDVNGVRVAKPGGDPPMAPDEENEAYQIVLERAMEHGGSGRSGIKFIRDARGELNAKRQALRTEMTNLQNTIAEQRQTILDLSGKLQSSDVSNADKQTALNEAMAKLADSQNQLTVCHDNMVKIDSPTPPQPKASPVVKLLAWGIRNRTKLAQLLSRKK